MFRAIPRSQRGRNRARTPPEAVQAMRNGLIDSLQEVVDIIRGDAPSAKPVAEQGGVERDQASPSIPVVGLDPLEQGERGGRSPRP